LLAAQERGRRKPANTPNRERRWLAEQERRHGK
jgi:hypothetical protein